MIEIGPEQMHPIGLTAREFGWPWEVTPQVATVVEDMNDCGVVQNLMESEQVKAIGWLVNAETRPHFARNKPTLIAQEFFVRLANLHIVAKEGLIVGYGELVDAREAIESALNAQNAALKAARQVPDATKHFRYEAGFIHPLECALEALQLRLDLISNQIEDGRKLSEILIGRPPSNKGRARSWLVDALTIFAVDVFLNVTGHEPGRNLPVRSFEGFLKRFSKGLWWMEDVTFRHLADTVMADGGYKGTWLQRDVWLSPKS